MSEARRLQDKLAKLNAAAEGADSSGRNIHAADKNGLLLAMLHEIDETILARKLTFENDKGSTLVFEVAARRLLCLSDQSTDGKSSSHETLSGRSFSEASDPLVDALAARLDDFLKDTSKLFVRSANTSRATDPSDIGCSPERLAQAWSLDLYDSKESAATDHVETFVAACAENSLASVQFDSENIIQKSGQADELNRLVELAQRDHSQLDMVLDNCLPKSGKSRCVMFGSNQPNRQSILYVVGGTARALVMISSEQSADIIALWRSISE